MLREEKFHFSSLNIQKNGEKRFLLIWDEIYWDKPEILWIFGKIDNGLAIAISQDRATSGDGGVGGVSQDLSNTGERGEFLQLVDSGKDEGEIALGIAGKSVSR